MTGQIYFVFSEHNWLRVKSTKCDLNNWLLQNYSTTDDLVNTYLAFYNTNHTYPK